ncbi:hypothetical protein K474DRAFT_1643541 [Panus rudis PR-1116 ss-1]|nr:hypothetical protein K474DRAFT_1643541 [Panus rudis PR-1116 ss-1]
MPAKYSHAKKRPPGSAKKSSSSSNNGNGSSSNGSNVANFHSKDHRTPNPHVDRSISQAMTAVSKLERTIAQILLIRFEQDIARLFSTHLYCIALLQLPTFVLRCITVGGPGWVAANADCDEIKDFFRSAIGMDLRQAGERVATKSVLWSYTALRHFAISNNVPICRKRGLHSLRLLPHLEALQAHLDTLQAMPTPAFAKPPHLGSLSDAEHALEDACSLKYSRISVHGGDWDPEWREKIKVGYERVAQTLWRVAKEFDVRGYGLVLRDKLTTKWCDCGCSTDHLSEVCEKTVREEEEESGVRPGKQREWDGRGSGVHGWETEEEEDIWEVDLDFVSIDAEESKRNAEPDMTIGQLMEYRYLRAEYEKEQGNCAFKKGDYEVAIERYKTAHTIEPEMPHYQLNMAAAYLKLKRWMEAEKACDTALSQHRSVKGYWRRAQARKAQGRTEAAIKDLRAVLKLQPSNAEAQVELAALLPQNPQFQRMVSSRASPIPSSSSGPPSSHAGSSSAPAQSSSSSSSATPTKGRQKQKQPPFPLTPTDSRKLKITHLPMTVDVPVGFDPFMFSGSGLFKNLKTDTASGMHVVTETVTYPSWDRYVVQKVSD